MSNTRTDNPDLPLANAAAMIVRTLAEDEQTRPVLRKLFKALLEILLEVLIAKFAPWLPTLNGPDESR